MASPAGAPVTPAIPGALLRRPLAVACVLLLVLGASACAGDGGNLLGPAGTRLHLQLSGIRELDPDREGTFEAWVLDEAGKAHSAGRMSLASSGGIELVSPIAGGRVLQITVEPPGDTDPEPSPQVLLSGSFRRGRAELRLEGAVTAADLPFRDNPGQYTVFTPSDNHKYGYPSNEHAGIWLVNSTVISLGIDQWVRLTPLKPGWVYEGWMVRDLGESGEIWMSYGKFTPSSDGAVNRRDDNGWGPFSGVDDYVTAGAEDYPGDDWVANPFGFPVPGNLDLPVDFREKDATGEFRWTHVITVEPAWNQGEAVSSERPFLLRPYRDRFTMIYDDNRDIGRGRPITLRLEGLPRGVVEVRR